MDFARRSFAQVKAFLGGLSADTRYLLVCLAVIAAGVIFFVSMYVGSGSYAPVGVPADRQAQATSQFDGAGIRYKIENGALLVAAKDQPRAFAILAEQSLLGPNIGGAFQAMLQNQGPWNSNEQNRQALLIAKQDWLSAVIGEMTGVKNAHVILDVPKHRGFGDTAEYGSASVSVVMQPNVRISKDNVDAIAGLVSGAVARIRLQDVSVVDAGGKRYTVDSDAMSMPGKTFEVVQAQERSWQRKIEDALSYIPGVIVAVNVQTDRVLNKRTTQYAYENSEPLRSTHTSETSRTQTRNSSEPGARPNVGVSLDSGGGATTVETSTEESNEFDKKNLTSHTQVVEAGYQTRQVSVAIGVPRAYFVGLYKMANPDVETAPRDADIQPIVDEELARIKTYVAPLIQSDTNKGIVEARMAPDTSVMYASMGLGGQETGTLLDQAKQWPIASTALVLLAMGLMMFMFRKAVQQPQLPTVEELAGVPPSLPSDEDIIGEAAESDATMEGIEVDEDELESRKIAEQINDLVKSNPGEAAALFNRWLRTDEY